jgi:hypothetical protein
MKHTSNVAENIFNEITHCTPTTMSKFFFLGP